MSFAEQAATMSREEIVALLVRNQALFRKTQDLTTHNESLNSQVSELKQQLEWFKRQVFGEKSERRMIPGGGSGQLSLGDSLLGADTTPPPETETIKSYERKRRAKEALPGSPDDSGLRFDETVPVEVVPVPNPELKTLTPDEYEVIDEKVSYRLAQKPGSYVVLKFVREVVKLKGSEKFSCPAAPVAVIEKGFADVSFLAGLCLDKFLWHLPLYRQHQRLLAAGIKISRVTLTNYVHRTAQLLEPVYYALLSSILQSSVLTMDETPIKTGRQEPGKLHRSYFWPLYGDQDEIAFIFSPTRGAAVVRETLGQYCGVLVTDGYKVYEHYAAGMKDVTHAQCWVHVRRYFDGAKADGLNLSDKALELIGEIYQIEAEIQERKLTGQAKLKLRQERSKPRVDQFFAWLSTVFQERILLSSNAFTKAANYALDRERELRVFLDNPDVPLDTNHVERQIRSVAVGRKNYLFCWTEVGARYAGIIYSFIASCKLQGLDPYTYLVDVLQRIETHPIREVHLLTPRLWKQNFAGQPLRSAIDRVVKNDEE